MQMPHVIHDVFGGPMDAMAGQGQIPDPQKLTWGWSNLRYHTWSILGCHNEAHGPCFGHLIQRSGCFPAWPYPPEQAVMT